MTLNPAKPTIELWSDGSIQPANPGPHGGWGAIIVGEEVNEGHKYRAMAGYYSACPGYLEATSQRSEAFAVLRSLQALPTACRINLVTDSQYVIRSIQNLQRGKMPKANSDIWREMAEMVEQHEINTDHVYGHTGVDLNEWADKLAYNAAYEMLGRDEYHDCIPGIRKYIPARS
jgi:ribonuclease HI